MAVITIVLITRLELMEQNCPQTLLCFVVLVTCNSLQPPELQPARLLSPWDSPGKNTGVGCHSILQGDLPNPGIEPQSPALQVDSLPSEPPEMPLRREGHPINSAPPAFIIPFTVGSQTESLYSNLAHLEFKVKSSTGAWLTKEKGFEQEVIFKGKKKKKQRKRKRISLRIRLPANCAPIICIQNWSSGPH